MNNPDARPDALTATNLARAQFYVCVCATEPWHAR